MKRNINFGREQIYFIFLYIKRNEKENEGKLFIINGKS